MSDANTETYDLVVNGALVPIDNLSLGINYAGPDIPTWEHVDFTGSPKIAAEEGSSTAQIRIVEFKGSTQVGSAIFRDNPFSSTNTFDLSTTPGTYDITSFGSFTGEFDAYSGHEITGTLLGQPTTDQAPIKPFAGVVVTDAIPNAGNPDYLSITPSSLANGVLSDPNKAIDGGHFVGGSYDLTGTASALSVFVDALVFSPTAHEAAPGRTVTTTFTVQNQNQNQNQYGKTTELASVVATALPDAAVTHVDGAASGHAVLTGTNGPDFITAHGMGNLILAQSGDDVIDAGSGDAVIQASGGNKNIVLGDGLNLIHGGNGNDIVSGAPGGSTAVLLGNGDDTVDLGGNSNYVLLGNGNDSVFLSGGLSFISTGSGNDDITVSGTGNTINAGGGDNYISPLAAGDTFVLPKAFQGVDTINGFYDTSTSFKFDLRNALAATSWNGSASALGKYVHVDQYRVANGGVNVGIDIAPNGTGAGQQIALATGGFLGSGMTTLNSLLSSHSLIT